MTLFRSLAAGAAAGLRSMTAPAAAFSRKGNTWTQLLPLLAAGEMVVDLLPGTPDRTIPPALAARALSGALAGAEVAGLRGGSRALGALVGIAGAVAASYLGVAYRHAAARRKIPDVAAALLEDALAIGLGLASVRSGAS